MGEDKMKKIEETYLRLFKYVILAVLSIALLTSLICVVMGSRAFFATEDQPTPAQTAPKPSVDINKFLNSFDEKPTPVPVKHTSSQNNNSKHVNNEQVIDEMVDNYRLNLWGYVDGYQKACNLPKQIDEATFMKKFPKVFFKDWFRAYGKDFAESQDAFEKTLLSNPRVIELGKNNPKYSVLMISLYWHANEWEKAVEKSRTFERNENIRVATFIAKEKTRVYLLRSGAMHLLITALSAFGIFMALVLVLIFSKIETDLMEIRDLMKLK